MNRLLLCCLTLLACASALPADLAAQTPTSAKLRIDQSTGIPGATLDPGSYTLVVVDHLSDRYVLRVEGGPTKAPSFLAIPNAKLKGETGEIKWKKGLNSAVYLKGWNFGGAAVPLEFVYPKDDAVALAKANGTSVAAIDPASEGRVSNNGLSKEDMQMVTLWLLSPTHVGPGAAAGGIKAQRYDQVASLGHKPALTALPHTASYLPLVLLAGFFSLMVAGGLRVFALARR